jgi:hypothetical protein
MPIDPGTRVNIQIGNQAIQVIQQPLRNGNIQITDQNRRPFLPFPIVLVQVLVNCLLGNKVTVGT